MATNQERSPVSPRATWWMSAGNHGRSLVSPRSQRRNPPEAVRADGHLDLFVPERVVEGHCEGAFGEPVERSTEGADEIGLRRADRGVGGREAGDLRHLGVERGGQLPGVVRSLGADHDDRSEMVAVAPDRGHRQVAAVAEAEQAQALGAEGLAQALQVVGALAGVERGEIDPLGPEPVDAAGEAVPEVSDRFVAG